MRKWLSALLQHLTTKKANRCPYYDCAICHRIVVCAGCPYQK